MKASTLLNVLDLQDNQNNIWLFTPSMWRILFPLESNNSLKISLQRHLKSGLLKKDFMRMKGLSVVHPMIN